MKWVLNTYRTCQNWTVDQIINVCLQTGHTGIEFLMDFKQAHGVEADASPDHVTAVARQVRDAGLEVAFVTSCATFDQDDPAALAQSVDKVKRVIDHAERMGCRHVRVLGDRVPDDPAARERRVDQVARSIATVADYAQGAGISVSMEMHGHFIDPELAKAVMERANRPNVGLVFNCVWRVGSPTGWSLPAGAPSIKPLYDLTRRWYTSVHTHAFERPEETLYYRELFQLLKADGFQGYISNECAYVGPDPITVLRLYTAFFRALAT